MTIKLSSGGFQLLPEGRTVLKITEVEYDEDFGIVELKCITPEGSTHRERFGLQDSEGEVNQGALNAFSYFAKVALNNMDLEEIDPMDLLNCYIEGDVKHVQSKKINESTGKPYVNVQISNYKASSGFGSKAIRADEEVDGIDDVDLEVGDSDDLDDWLD